MHKLLFVIALVYSLQAAASEGSVVRIGGINDRPTPPFFWVDECKNDIVGVLRKAIESALHPDYRLEFLPAIQSSPQVWKVALEQLERGDYDLQIGMFVPAPPGFTTTDIPIITYRTSIFMRDDTAALANGSNVIELNSLKKKKGLLLQAHKEAAEYPLFLRLQKQGFDISASPDIGASLMALVSDEVDYIIGEHYFVSSKITQLKLNKAIRFFDAGMKRGVYAGVKTDGPWMSLIPLLNERLKRFHDSGITDSWSNAYLLYWLRGGDCGS